VNCFAGKEVKVSGAFLQAAVYAWEMARKSHGAFNPLHRTGAHYSKLMINENS